MLVISQTQRVHRQIEGLLAANRIVKAEVLDGAAVGKTPVTRGFALNGQAFADSQVNRVVLRETLQASVDWDNYGEFGDEKVFLHVLPPKVIVRHLPKVVDQVEMVLRDIGVTADQSSNTQVEGDGGGGGLF